MNWNLQTRLKILSVHKRDLYVDNIDNVVKIDNMDKTDSLINHLDN